MGDFNINLLGYESDSETNDFINTMVSHYLLPYISIQQESLITFSLMYVSLKP